MISSSLEKGVENMEQIYRTAPMPKYVVCSPVNLLLNFRTPFYKNTYGRLLLYDLNLPTVRVKSGLICEKKISVTLKFACC